MALGRAVIRLIDDTGGIQKIQAGLMANETRSGIERFQEYGFTSVPHEGAEAAVMFIGGMRDHGIIIATEDRRYRIKAMEGGEVALYTDEGDKIHLKRGNKIDVETGTFKIDCEEFVVNASSNASFYTPILRADNDIIDNFVSNPDSLAGMRSIFNGHTHAENDSGGPTDPPNSTMGS